MASSLARNLRILTRQPVFWRSFSTRQVPFGVYRLATANHGLTTENTLFTPIQVSIGLWGCSCPFRSVIFRLYDEFLTYYVTNLKKFNDILVRFGRFGFIRRNS